MDNRYKSINRYNQSPARLRCIRYIHVYRTYISNYESKSFNLSQSLPPYFFPPYFSFESVSKIVSEEEYKEEESWLCRSFNDDKSSDGTRRSNEREILLEKEELKLFVRNSPPYNFLSPRGFLADVSRLVMVLVVVVIGYGRRGLYRKLMGARSKLNHVAFRVLSRVRENSMKE